MGKEIISKFKEKPKTKTAWRAMGLGLGTILVMPMLGIFAAVIRPMIDKATDENIGAIVGFCSGIVLLAFIMFAFITGVRAFRKGERSWIMWAGFVPAILAVALLVFMVIGEFIFPH